jgi:DNA invertase Pin-like site-specific DNA recombinase
MAIQIRVCRLLNLSLLYDRLDLRSLLKAYSLCAMKIVNYYRCSTKKQDYSIDSQRLQVANWLKTVQEPYQVLKEFSEIESGRNSARPVLLEALAFAKQHKARIVCSRLDRLSRSTLYTLQLIQQSGVEFTFCDAPGMDFVQLGITAILSEREVALLSKRTSEGLKIAAKRLAAEGRRLGNPRPEFALKRCAEAVQTQKNAFNNNIIKIIHEIRETGIGNNLARIAECLNRRGYVGRSGGRFTATAVSRILGATGDVVYLARRDSKIEVAEQPLNA